MSSIADKTLKFKRPRLRGRRRARFVSAVRDLRRTLTFAGIMIAAGLLEVTYLYAETDAFWASIALVVVVVSNIAWRVWRRGMRLVAVLKWLAFMNLALVGWLVFSLYF